MLLFAPFILFALLIGDAFNTLEDLVRITDRNSLPVALCNNATKAFVTAAVLAAFNTETGLVIGNAEHAVNTVAAPFTIPADRNPHLDGHTLGGLWVATLAFGTLNAFADRYALARRRITAIPCFALDKVTHGAALTISWVASLSLSALDAVTGIATLSGLEVTVAAHAGFGRTGSRDAAIAFTGPFVGVTGCVSNLLYNANRAILRVEL